MTMNNYLVRMSLDCDDEGRYLEEDEMFLEANDFEITDGGGLIFYKMIDGEKAKVFGIAPDTWATVQMLDKGN